MHPLVGTEELASMLEQGHPPSILDVRWRLADPSGSVSYAQGHLPGAVFVDVETELAGPPGEDGRHPLPDPARLQVVLRSAGVVGERPVVVYDDADGSVAARAWWLLRWVGHSRVAVLDGGYAAWCAEAKPITTTTPVPARGDIGVEPGHMPVLDSSAAADCARSGVLLDARAPERYTGAREPVDSRAGHIPGALNAPFAEHVDSHQRWRSASELTERFAQLGVTGEVPIGAYCGSGVTATSVILALEVAGLPHQAALYAGSWSHWVRDAARPAVTGEHPG